MFASSNWKLYLVVKSLNSSVLYLNPGFIAVG